MSRTVIVPQTSPVLRDASTHVLFHYANGELLVETDAATVEDARGGGDGGGDGGGGGGGQDGEIPVTTGLAIGTPHQLAAARSGLDAVPGNAPATAYVELRGPADGDMLAAIERAGVHPQQFVPAASYLCTGTGAALRAVRALPFVRSVIPVGADLKARVPTSEDANAPVDVEVVASAALVEAGSFAEQLAAVPGVTVEGPAEAAGAWVRVPAKVTTAGQEALLADRRIVAVEPRAAKVPEDEVADLVLVAGLDAANHPEGSYTTWLDDHAVNGTGVTIGIVDGGVDVSHPAFTGRITDLAAGQKAWHATFVAGHAAGSYLDSKDKDGFVYGLGVAPCAGLLAQDMTKNAGTLCSETVSSSSPAGVAGSIQNNSWGAGTHDPMDYLSLEATYDGLVRNATGAAEAVPLTICFSVGNDGTAGITRPHGAKNLIVTGNSENYRPDFGGTDADNVREVYSGAHASSIGNCGDGRIRPHVVAPGEWTASANYDSHPGEKEYVDDRITWGGGSSGASPKTAGACALLTQWWRAHDGGASPSPAMLRALVVNGAEPIDSGGTVPNTTQGWGRLDLDNVVSDTVHRCYVDQTILLTSRGDSRTWTIRPTDPTRPLRVTLAWTDPPGAPGTGTATAPAVVNKLALRARSKGLLYRANQFGSGWSVPDQGEQHEGWDNTQCVFLRPEDLDDTVEVSVTALDLAMNCLTNTADTPQQDFALVIRGGFLDQGATPADVFLVIDPAAGSASIDTTSNWAPGSSDSAAVGSPPVSTQTARPTTAATTTPGSDGSSAGSNGSGAGSDGSGTDSPTTDSWWNEPGAATETTRALPPVPPAVLAGAAAGLGIARGAAAVSTPDAAARPVDDLGAALARIDASWATHDGTRRRAAVLVVGDATRVSLADVATLRRLAFRGELWVLSSTRSVLGFLAQRVHRRTGVHYRLSLDANGLAQSVRDALAEAAGFQRLEVRTRVLPPATDCEFDVLPADEALLLRVQSPQAHALVLRLAEGSGAAPVQLTPGALPAGVSVTVSDGLVEVRTPVLPGRAGPWTLSVTFPAGSPPPVVDVYARSRFAPGATRTDTGAGPLVAVHGGSSGRLGRLHFEPPRVAGATGQVRGLETDRGIDLVSTTSRLDQRGPVQEAPKEVLVRSLGTVVRTQQVGRGARVIDLIGTASGAVATGHRFSRKVRTGVVELEPRSVWRASLPPAPVITTAATEVVDVARGADGVSALTLCRGPRRRRIAVPDPALRRRIADLDLTDRHLIFAVRGSDLVAVVRGLDGIRPGSAVAQPPAGGAPAVEDVRVARTVLLADDIQNDAQDFSTLDDRPPQLRHFPVSPPHRSPVVLRPVWHGPAQVLPVPVPTLGAPVAVGDFVLWPDQAHSQAYFSLAAPRLRTVSLVVDRADVPAAGGTTTKITGGNAVVTVSAYADDDPTRLPALRAGWATALIGGGYAGAGSWQYAPLSLQALDGLLDIPATDLAGPVTVATARDAGTVVFSVPLSETGALGWSSLLNSSSGSRIVGACTLKAKYAAKLGDTVVAQDSTLACALGTLLAGAGPGDVTTVDPQVTVVSQVIVTPNQLVDSVTVDLLPSQGAPPASLTFTKEGGQTPVPVTAQHIETVTVGYDASVRFTQAGWPLIPQKGTLDFAKADWNLWIKPDSWLVEFSLLALFLDAQNQVQAAQGPTDVVTLRMAYNHPVLAGPLTLAFAAPDNQLVTVPFPVPPGAAAPPTLELDVLGTRGPTVVGPKSRVLTAEETMIVVKIYANGAVDITTNKDHVAEGTQLDYALSMLANLHG
ncbi:S8 family serine peptidase [Streptomyces rubellomurinus]|uniref:Peptidase S8/S53 domain-containing protein n=1 Tax=Streptomyces rubellomurinus (strain ATCC 31215) TaxID=359131 RepID=A0A0F2TBY8_STRR3|nr:S8 family serine peptidase [Streptomyces rubellomurinus]KJS59981.1 hypothetical protein VM95_23965 [Streptomyces rubellomurinus]